MGNDAEVAAPVALLRSLVTADPAEAGEGGHAITFKSGNTYVGTLANGATMDVGGTYTWASKAGPVVYEGAFASNVIEGEGKYEWADGSRYEGHLSAGKRSGTGTFSGPGGYPRYEGEWKAGRRHGRGKLVYGEGGDVYDGDWVDDMRSGRGTHTHASGNVYDGEWSADKKNGQGTFEWFDRRERYVGEWKDGLAHGQGEHAWLRAQQDSNPFQLRERYVGEWVAGHRHGQGTFYLASGARYVGEWSGSQKHGMGLFSFEDGSLYEGLFEHDRMTDGQLRATSELYAYLDLRHLLPPNLVDDTCAAVRHILVRHNTDVKQVYRFYSALGRVAEDAFDMTLAQMRTFAIDAGLVSPTLPTSMLDQLVMRSSSSQPTARTLPRPLVLATAIAGTPASPGEVAEVAAAAKFALGGVHDGERTLLLREFVQGLVEIAAAGLANGTVAEHTELTPTPPLAQALLDMLQALSSVTPTSLDSAVLAGGALSGGGGTAEEVAAVRSRLQLVYGSYAAGEPPPRFGRPPAEATLSVRAYVMLLRDGGLLESGADVSALLAHTLPEYYLPPLPEEPAADGDAESLILDGEVEVAESAASGEAATGGEALPEGEAAEGEAAEGEAVDPKAPPAEEAPPPVIPPVFSPDALEEAMELRLIYSEFESSMVSFGTLYESPPWAPTRAPSTVPPSPDPKSPEPEDVKEAASAEAAVEAAAAEDAAAETEAAEEAPVGAVATLRVRVLPKIGAHLLAKLSQLATNA